MTDNRLASEPISAACGRNDLESDSASTGTGVSPEKVVEAVLCDDGVMDKREHDSSGTDNDYSADNIEQVTVQERNVLDNILYSYTCIDRLRAAAQPFVPCQSEPPQPAPILVALPLHHRPTSGAACLNPVLQHRITHIETQLNQAGIELTKTVSDHLRGHGHLIAAMTSRDVGRLVKMCNPGLSQRIKYLRLAYPKLGSQHALLRRYGEQSNIFVGDFMEIGSSRTRDFSVWCAPLGFDHLVHEISRTLHNQERVESQCCDNMLWYALDCTGPAAFARCRDAYCKVLQNLITHYGRGKYSYSYSYM